MGGSPSIPQRAPGLEWPSISAFEQKNIGQFNKFNKNNPILSELGPGAIDYFNSPTSPLLKALQGEGLSQLQAGQSPLLQQLNQQATKGSPLSNYLTGQAMNQSPLLEQLNQRAMDAGPSSLLTSLQGVVGAPDYLSGKVSQQELSNVVDQPTLAKFASMGNIGGNQAALQNFLNRDQYTQARQAEHLGQAQGVEGLSQAQVNAANQFGLGVGGLNQAHDTFGLGVNAQQQQFGLGVQGQNVADEAARIANAGQVQGLSNQDILQRFQIPQGVLQSETSAYTGLTNPILGYMQDLFSSNQNAAAAESVAGSNKSSGAVSGGLGALGAVAGAVGIAV